MFAYIQGDIAFQAQSLRFRDKTETTCLYLLIVRHDFEPSVFEIAASESTIAFVLTASIFHALGIRTHVMFKTEENQEAQ